MASETSSDIILSIPIYIQVPAAEGGTLNRHILISLRVLQVGADSVRLESAWNTVDAPPYSTAGVVGLMVPRRRGVQVFMPRDPLDMPIYVIITRSNRFGSLYHLVAAVHVHEWIQGIIEVETTFMRVRRRNVHRSPPVCILRSRDIQPDDVGPSAHTENEDANDGGIADSTEVQV